MQQRQLTYLSVPFWFLSLSWQFFPVVVCSNRNVNRSGLCAWGKPLEPPGRCGRGCRMCGIASVFVLGILTIVDMILYNVGPCVLKSNVYACCFGSCPVLYMKNDPFQRRSLDSFHGYQAVWLPRGIFKFCEPRCVWWSGASIILKTIKGLLWLP